MNYNEMIDISPTYNIHCMRNSWMAGYNKDQRINRIDDWKRCVSLAIMWNKADERRIFNNVNEDHLQVSDKVHALYREQWLPSAVFICSKQFSVCDRRDTGTIIAISGALCVY